MTKIEARLPEVGEYVRMFGTLVEVQDVTPPPPPKEVDYIFEDTIARVEVLANGRTLKNGSTFNNFGGKDTCVDTAIREAKKCLDYYGDGIEVRVVKVTRRCRMRPDDHEHLSDPQFVGFAGLGFESHRDLPESIEEVVWTSKAGGET